MEVGSNYAHLLNVTCEIQYVANSMSNTSYGEQYQIDTINDINT